MKRQLSGELRHLAPATLLRVLSATSTSGVLELETAVGSLRLEVVQGRAAAASDELLTVAARVLRATAGSYRFQPLPMPELVGVTLPLAAWADAALSWSDRRRNRLEAEVDTAELLAGNLIDFSAGSPANIHVLPQAPPENPLDELLEELEANAPGEILFLQVAVLTSDPRPWRGSLEADWRRRGWQLRLLGSPTGAPTAGLDLVIVHHRLSVTRVGSEQDWLDLVRRASESDPPLPVVWVGPLGDPSWVSRLIEAGATFLMPPPAGDSGETLHRFQRALTTVVERQLAAAPVRREPEVASAVSELVDALLHDAEPEQALASLLQMAAGLLLRGAVMRVEETAFRCRAGFGYPLPRGTSALPRGVGLLEQVVRRREPAVGIDPERGGAVQLARALGLERLPAETAVVPLGAGAAVSAVLVADREGQPLPDLTELVQLVSRLGAILVQG